MLESSHELEISEKVDWRESEFIEILAKLQPSTSRSDMNEADFQSWLTDTITEEEYRKVIEKLGILKFGKVYARDLENFNEIVMEAHKSVEGTRVSITAMVMEFLLDKLLLDSRPKGKEFWIKSIIPDRVSYISSRQLFLVSHRYPCSNNLYLYRLAPNSPVLDLLACIVCPGPVTDFTYIPNKDLLLVSFGTALALYPLYTHLFSKYSINPVWTIHPKTTI